MLIKTAGRKLRLVVTDDTMELACSKETPGKLSRFLASVEDGSLFKGRIQFHKSENTITVMLKGNKVGSINLSNLKEILNAYNV